MNTFVSINNGIIEGYYMRDILSVLPQLESCFERRKQFDEYYYNGKGSIDIGYGEFRGLSNMFEIKLLRGSLEIVI